MKNIINSKFLRKIIALTMATTMAVSLLNLSVFGANSEIPMTSVPANNATAVDKNIKIKLDFSPNAVYAESFTTDSVTINGSNKMVEAIQYDGATPNVIVIKPTELVDGTRYNVDLTNVQINVGGTQTAVNKRVNFTTSTVLPTLSNKLIVHKNSKNFDGVPSSLLKPYFINWGLDYENEKIVNGIMSFDKVAAKAATINTMMGGFEANDVNKIEFKVRATGDTATKPAQHIKMYYQTSGDSVLNEDKTMVTDYFIADGNWHTVSMVPTTADVKWTGDITGVRFDFNGSATHFEVDYINLIRDNTKDPIIKRYDFKGYQQSIMANYTHEEFTTVNKDFGIEVKSKPGTHFYSEGVTGGAFKVTFGDVSKIVVRMRTKSELRMAMYLTYQGWNLGQSPAALVWTPAVDGEFHDYELSKELLEMSAENKGKEFVQFTFSLAGGNNDHGVNCSDRAGDYDIQSVTLYGKDNTPLNDGYTKYDFTNSANTILNTTAKNATLAPKSHGMEITATDSSTVLSNPINIPVSGVQSATVRMRTQADVAVAMYVYSEVYKEDGVTASPIKAVWIPTKGEAYADYELDLSKLSGTFDNFVQFSLATINGDVEGQKFDGKGLYEIESITLKGYNYVDPKCIMQLPDFVYGNFNCVSNFEKDNEAIVTHVSGGDISMVLNGVYNNTANPVKLMVTSVLYHNNKIVDTKINYVDVSANTAISPISVTLTNVPNFVEGDVIKGFVWNVTNNTPVLDNISL